MLKLHKACRMFVALSGRRESLLKRKPRIRGTMRLALKIFSIVLRWRRFASCTIVYAGGQEDSGGSMNGFRCRLVRQARFPKNSSQSVALFG